MNIRWSKLLHILREGKVPFTTSIEGENIETIYLKGKYMESCYWNQLHILDQLDFLKSLGVRYERTRLTRWKSYQDRRQRGYL